MRSGHTAGNNTAGEVPRVHITIRSSSAEVEGTWSSLRGAVHGVGNVRIVHKRYRLANLRASSRRHVKLHVGTVGLRRSVCNGTRRTTVRG